MRQTIRALATISVVPPTTTSSDLTTRPQNDANTILNLALVFGLLDRHEHHQLIERTNALRQLFRLLRPHVVHSSETPDRDLLTTCPAIFTVQVEIAPPGSDVVLYTTQRTHQEISQHSASPTRFFQSSRLQPLHPLVTPLTR